MLTVWSCSKKSRLTVQFVDYRVTKKVTSPKSNLSAVVTTDALFPPTLIQTESVSVIATDQHFVFSRFKLPREGVILTKVRHIVLFLRLTMAKSVEKIWIIDLVSDFDQSEACCAFLRQDFVSSINRLVRGKLPLVGLTRGNWNVVYTRFWPRGEGKVQNVSVIEISPKNVSKPTIFKLVSCFSLAESEHSCCCLHLSLDSISIQLLKFNVYHWWILNSHVTWFNFNITLEIHSWNHLLSMI